MRSKWVGVIAFWTAFFAYMIAGLHSTSRWVDAALPILGSAVVLFLAFRVILQCLRRSSSAPFWQGRGYPKWFLRFVIDQDRRGLGKPPDPVL